MQNEQKQSYKDKALAHVRSICPELMELSFGCEVERGIGLPKQKATVIQKSGVGWMLWLHGSEICHAEHTDKLNIIGHTPHLEHWLRGLNSSTDSYCHSIFDNGELTLSGKPVTVYDLTKDGENQSEEFYKAYCEIVGINNQ